MGKYIQFNQYWEPSLCCILFTNNTNIVLFYLKVWGRRWRQKLWCLAPFLPASKPTQPLLHEPGDQIMVRREQQLGLTENSLAWKYLLHIQLIFNLKLWSGLDEYHHSYHLRVLSSTTRIWRFPTHPGSKGACGCQTQGGQRLCWKVQMLKMYFQRGGWRILKLYEKG